MNIDIEGSVITDKGMLLINKLLRCRGELRLTAAYAGDGLLPEEVNPEGFTDLIHRTASLSIMNFSNSNTGEAVIRLQATSLGVSTGYFIREAGVFAEDPDEGEILYAYAVLQDKPLWIRPEGHAVTNLTELLIAIIIDRVKDVTINLSTSGLISLADLNERLAPLETYYPLLTINHDLRCCPQLIVAALKYGAGMGLAGESPAGGTDAEGISAQAIYHSSGALTVKTIKAVVDMGIPELHKINSREYTVTFEGNDADSLYIRLI